MIGTTSFPAVPASQCDSLAGTFVPPAHIMLQARRAAKLYAHTGARITRTLVTARTAKASA
jgi:hypothetical protein